MMALLTTSATIVVFCLLDALILSSGRVAVAAEGASSNYFPGSNGTVAIATPPTVGWSYLNYNLFFAADTELAVLQGRLNVDLDTVEKPVLGSRFAMGGTLPLGYADLESLLVGPPAMAVDDSATGLGDGSLLPAAFYWNDGNWNSTRKFCPSCR